MGFPVPPQIPEGLLGRPSRKAATAALEAHLQVLKGEPLRSAISECLRAKSGLGGQERRFVALVVRELSRQQRLLDLAAKQLGQAPSRWALREDQALIRYTLWRRLFTGESWSRIGTEVKLPGPIRPRSIKDAELEQVGTAEIPEPELPEVPWERAAVLHSFTGWFAEKLHASLGDAAPEAMAALSTEAPLVMRARPPGSRDEVLAMLAAENIPAHPLAEAPDALVIDASGHQVFESRAMKSGRLQVQDLGSQLIALCARPARPGGFAGATLADACAGAGGKTLVLADLAGSTGRVQAGDASQRRLHDARVRTSKFKLGNVRFDVPARLEGADAVLIDAPCSGSGSVHREPDVKWKLTLARVKELAAIQDALLDDLLPRVRPGAVVVYATCSLFREENEDRVRAALDRHPGFRLEEVAGVLPEAARPLCRGPFLQVLPQQGRGGGFFAARLVRTE